MSDALEFDIVSELAGFEVPSEDVTVFGNAKAAYDFQQVVKEIGNRKQDTSIPQALQKKLEKAKARLVASQYKLKVQGITPERKKQILAESYKQFKPSYTQYGMIQQDPERDEFYGTLLWLDQITAISRADGAVVPAITPEIIEALRGSLPDRSTEVVREAMARLNEDAANGIDFVMADVDFLSQHSPEA